MAYSSLSGTDTVDRRILREEYRGYDLVARFWEYGNLGKIWKHRRPVEEIDADEGEGLDELMREMRALVDSLIADKSRSRKNRPPSQAELIDALKLVADKFTPLEKLLLKTHADMEGGVIPMSMLQRLLNLSSPDSVYELYARIGSKINDEVGYLPKVTRTSNPHLKQVIEIEGKGADVTLRLPEPLQLFVQVQGW